MVKIIPAILATSVEEFEEKYKRVKELVDRIQVDVIDEAFGGVKTIEPMEIVGPGHWLDKDSVKDIKLDVHLMVEEPVEWLEQCRALGADRVFGQVEKMEDSVLFVAEGQIKGFEVGLALDLDTPVEMIKPVIEDLDSVMLMSVKAGKSGQEFVDLVLPKIEEVRKLRSHIKICIDGGLDVEEIKQCLVAEWAEEIREGQLHRDFTDMEFAVGSALWEADDIKKKLEELESLHG